jgi:hypothetical protein
VRPVLPPVEDSEDDGAMGLPERRQPPERRHPQHRQRRPLRRPRRQRLAHRLLQKTVST